MTRTSRLAAMVVCALLSTAVAMAEPQRGGGSGSGGGGGGQRTAQPRDGGGHSGGGGGGVHPAPPHGGGVYGGGVYYGGPYYATRGSYVFVGGYFYDPFYGPYPWWPASAYGWGYYPVFDYRAEVRIQGTPREAAVYVDGFYAGIVDDFDGTFQRLPLTPGGHRIELFLEGYRTVRKSLYLQPGSTLKLHETMTPLAAGETSERPEVAPAVPPPPDGTYTAPPGGPWTAASARRGAATDAWETPKASARSCCTCSRARPRCRSTGSAGSPPATASSRSSFRPDATASKWSSTASSVSRPRWTCATTGRRR